MGIYPSTPGLSFASIAHVLGPLLLAKCERSYHADIAHLKIFQRDAGISCADCPMESDTEDVFVEGSSYGGQDGTKVLCQHFCRVFT